MSDTTHDQAPPSLGAAAAVRPTHLLQSNQCRVSATPHVAEMAATPNVMADVKDWLLNKCRDASSLLAVDRLPLHGGRQLTYSNVVVTPDNIPEFTIPSSMDTAVGGSPSALDTDLQSQSSSGGSVSSASQLRGSSICPRKVLYQQQSMTHRLVPTTGTRSQSAPVSPMRSLPTDPTHDELLNTSSPRFDDVSSESSLLGHTNSDPMSLAALSLPHLKMRTLYGFETLTESPHTRRKESLFHDDSIADGAVQGFPLIGRMSKRKTPSSLETLAPQIITEDVDRGTSGGRRHKRRHNIPSMIAPLGIILSPNVRVSSPQSSSCRVHNVGNIVDLGSSSTCGPRSTAHFCSCPEINTSSTLRGHSQRHRTSSCERQQHQQNLRRASLREENLLTSSCLVSPEVSPSLLCRRKSGSHLMPYPHTDQENLDILKAPSTVSSSGGSSPCSSCQSFSRCSEGDSGTGRLLELGQLRLSLLYLPKQRQLKVGLIRAENLTSSAIRAWSSPFHSGLSPKHSPIDSSPSEQNLEQLNPYVKLCLMPGKVQRHVSRVIRHTRNPVFSQDFVFSDLLRHEVPEMRLRLKVYHKTAKLGRDKLLGELQVSLAELIPSQETRLLRELEPVTSRHELGHIQISVCFYASAEKLTVAVHQVTDLSRHTFTGAPDPYVRVELSQPRRSTTSHQTKTKKKNMAPVFNESFTFPISPKIEDLHYTSLTVTVLDHSALRTDGQIGQVRLGFGATEETEFHHWNKVLQQPGRVATNLHLLMDPISD